LLISRFDQSQQLFSMLSCAQKQVFAGTMSALEPSCSLMKHSKLYPTKPLRKLGRVLYTY
jgi:hypothetical protein